MQGRPTVPTAAYRYLYRTRTTTGKRSRDGHSVPWQIKRGGGAHHPVHADPKQSYTPVLGTQSMEGVPATSGLGSEPILSPPSTFSAAAADIKPCQLVSSAFPEPTTNPVRVPTLLEICTVGDAELRQQDLLATGISEMKSTASPSEHETAFVAAPVEQVAVAVEEWRVQPGVNGKQITTSLGMEEARHHRRQLLKALALQDRGERYDN